MARKKIIAGNWKMNKTPSEAVALVEELKPLVANEEVDVVFCVPAIDIIPVVEAAKGTNIQVGAENMYFEESGAYTGEISPAMLVDAGVKYVVLGHSERREYFAAVSYTHLVTDSGCLVPAETADGHREEFVVRHVEPACLLYTSHKVLHGHCKSECFPGVWRFRLRYMSRIRHTLV